MDLGHVCRRFFAGYLHNSRLMYLINHRAPVAVSIAHLASPAASLELLTNHSIHEAMTGQLHVD